jgi:hypothetical protein
MSDQEGPHDERGLIEEIEERAECLEDMAGRQKEVAHEAEELAKEEDEEARELRKEVERLRENDEGRHHEEHKVEITMVVNGVPVEIKAKETETVAEVRHKALDETKNLGQPPENWEIKDEAGALLDPNKTVGDYHFGEKVTLFLSLKAGAAGA